MSYNSTVQNIAICAKNKSMFCLTWWHKDFFCEIGIRY